LNIIALPVGSFCASLSEISVMAAIVRAFSTGEDR